MHTPDSSDTHPPRGVTLLIRRRVKPGCEADYERWLERVMHAARERAEGFLGVDLHRPAAPSTEYRSILHFRDLAALEAFEKADWRLELMREIAPIVEGDAVWDRLTGLELWFDAPPGTPIPRPDPFRMALVLIVVVYSLVQIIGGLVALVLDTWPAPLRLFITICIEVLLMTYFIMPAISRYLAAWVYRR